MATWLRGQKVMLSHDLAPLYGVKAKVLVQAVKRNAERFPDDFAFQLTKQEDTILKSQFVTSSWGGARRALPYAFTEQGVAMLSSVLRCPREVQVNIEIMRAFVRLRQLLTSNVELARKAIIRKFRMIRQEGSRIRSPSSLPIASKRGTCGRPRKPPSMLIPPFHHTPLCSRMRTYST